MGMDNELRFAILIDADNVSDKYIKVILDETANNGIATYKRIYGDWTSKRLASWKGVLLENSIIPMQQYNYTTGKNSTDSAMIIDAMDILYSGTVDGFCIVSSDSDFTRLAARLRESGMQVIGMGEEKTPKPFISACNQFKYLDLLYSDQQEEEAKVPEPRQEELKTMTARDEEEENAKHPEISRGLEITTIKRKDNWSKDKEPKTEKPQEKQNRKNMKQKDLTQIRKTINAIINKFSDEDGWMFSGKLGDQLAKRLPDFDVRNYGFSKLTPFISSLGDYEINKRHTPGGQKHIYIRLKG